MYSCCNFRRLRLVERVSRKVDCSLQSPKKSTGSTQIDEYLEGFHSVDVLSLSPYLRDLLKQVRKVKDTDIRDIVVEIAWRPIPVLCIFIFLLERKGLLTLRIYATKRSIWL